MNAAELLRAITDLTSPAMLHAVALRAGAFWLAYVLTTGFWVWVWTFNKSAPKIWR